jgi:catechol 2,3-dioxygenase
VPLPTTDHDVPFDITRASHVDLRVADLDRSLEFYVQVIGLVVSDRDRDVAYLRGVEEAAHHSLVLRRSAEEARCGRLGFRVFTDEQLEALAANLEARGLAPVWAQADHQGRTLHVSDPTGVPLEFCARMPTEPRLVTAFDRHKGGAGLRLDHFQLHVGDVRAGCEFYTSLGFRVSEFLTPDDEELVAVFLQRKGNPHDLVLFDGPGPRFHHVAYTTPDVHTLVRACDVAGELGFGAAVERGPGRHGPGHALYVYMRDPDGHRVELFTTHYQTLDIDDEPVRWDVTDPSFGMPWGLPAQRSWHEEASCFVGVEPSGTHPEKGPIALEDFLMDKARGR